jgi:hypothetical protein
MYKEYKMAKSKEAMQEGIDEALSALEGFSGQGFENMDQRAMSLSFLQISQALSDVVTQKIMEEGLFYNTGTQTSYGTEVRVIPVHYELVWDEKEPGTGRTVERHKPNSIHLEELPVPPGSKNRFPKRINPETRNEVIETFAYALVLADHPEAGFVMHTAGVGSMKAYRKWNTMLAQMRLPSGKQSPLFGKIWRLQTESRISKTTNKPFYAMVNAIEEEWAITIPGMLEDVIVPARNAGSMLLLTATSNTADATEEADEE